MNVDRFAFDGRRGAF